MIFKNILAVLLLPLIISGCYAYKIFPKNYRSLKAPAPTETVYIINPELKKEYAILKSAGIYNITVDSTATIKIKLQPLQQHHVCGQPLVGSMITLGQLPVYLPDDYNYLYEEQEGGSIKLFRFQLKVAKRYWFWDMFTFQKNFKKQAGKALAGNFHENDLAARQTP